MWFELEYDTGNGNPKTGEIETVLKATPDALAHLIAEMTRIQSLPNEREHPLNYPADVAGNRPIHFVMIVPEPLPQPPSESPYLKDRLTLIGCASLIFFLGFLCVYGFIRLGLDTGLF